MPVSPRLLALAAALVAGLGLAGWLALRPAPEAPPVPVTGGVDATAAPDSAPEAVEGDEAELTDEQAAALDAAPPVIVTDEDEPGGEVDESLPDEAVPDADAALEGDEVPLTAPAADIDLPPGDPILLPSGRQVWWLDSAQDTQGVAGLTYRFRFVYPGLTPAMDADTQQAVHDDMEALCNSYAVPRLGRPGPGLPQQVVITLMQRPLTFGESDSGVAQFFEAFSLTAPPGAELRDPATPLTCRWEVY